MAIIIYAFLKHNIPIGIIAALAIVFLQRINHRTIVHSIGFGILVSVPLFFFIKPIYGIAGFIAYLSHLVADNELSWWAEKDINLPLMRR